MVVMVTALELFIDLIILIGVFIVIAFVMQFIVGVFSFYAPAQTWVSNFVHTIYTFVDGSLIILLILVLIFDLYSSYENPEVYKAVINLIMIFILGYISLIFHGTVTILTALNSTALPITTTVLSGSYITFLLLFFFVLGTIFNLRHKEVNEYEG